MHTRYISVWLAALFAVAGFLSPLQAQVCTVRGTVYQVDGVTPATGVEISVTRAEKTGYLYVNTTRTTKTNVLGKFTFTVPRTVGTDTAWVHIKSNVGELASGQILYVPDADSAVLGTWTSPTKPYFVPVLIGGGGTGDSVSLNNHPRILRIERDLGQFTSSTSDSLQQAQADAKLALNISQGKAGADSVHTVLVTLSNLIAGKGSADSIHSQLVVLYNIVAGKPNADSVHTAIDAMLKKADTAALHAQKFALINDSLAAISLRATTTKNDLTAHIGTADAHLPAQATHSGKFLQTNGTVTSWQTAVTAESDPTATAKAQAVVADSLNVALSDTVRKIPKAKIEHAGVANETVLKMRNGTPQWLPDSAGGGAALTNWSESDTSATQASRTLKPKAYTANVNAVIQPLGTGAFILGPPPDGTATGGNARGQDAIDLQLGTKGAATKVASGNRSIAIGGMNSASELYSTAIGYQNTASAQSAVALGRECTSSAIASVALGYQTTASGTTATSSGLGSAAVGVASVAMGYFAVANDSGQTALGVYPDTGGVHLLTVGNGTGAATGRRNAFAVYKDGSLQSTAYTRNIVTVGAGDSVIVTGLQNMLPTDAVTLAYQAGKTAHNAGETILSYAIYSATTLTIYGVENRKVAWIRMR